MKFNAACVAGACLLAATLAAAPARADESQQSLEELRNTVINLLDGLVQKGVLTREQAQQMVADAQFKAQARAKEKAAQEGAEKDAVRVTYVPDFVREQISKDVREQLAPEVTKNVVEQAKKDRWGVPGALPEWVANFKGYGDIRVRAQGDLFGSGNGSYFDYQTINARGGKIKAGAQALLNTTEDRERLRLRLRLGLDAKITDGWSAGVRLTTGSLTDPVSTNQTLGQSGQRYQFAVDQAYLRYQAGRDPAFPWLTAWAGRMPSPWLSSDLVWDPDLQFEGLATTLQLLRPAFLTLGAFPLQEVELSSSDKWLYGAQLGVDLAWGFHNRLRFAVADYLFRNVSGRLNAADSNLLDYTAPQFMQKGNTVFDIRNDADATTNLYALAAKYNLVNATLALQLPFGSHLLGVNADYVNNIGYKLDDVLQRVGYASLSDVPEPLRINFDKETTGYQGEVFFGTRDTGKRGNWRAALEYRYLERDAVLDAFTDSDFHLGGTGAKGYVLKGDWWFRNHVWLSARYLASSAIVVRRKLAVPISGATYVESTPAFDVDTIMLDLNGQF